MNDDEIEKAMLYYMIFQKEYGEVSEEDFFNIKHKQIIKAINKLIASEKEVTMLSVRDEIEGDKNECLRYLASLGDNIYTTSFETVYSLLKKYTKRREIFNKAKEIQNKIVSIDEIDAYIEKTISDLQKIELQTEKDNNFSNQVSDAVKLMEENMHKKTDYSLYTGFFKLDALTDGLHNGELTVVGARPRNWKDNICITNS